MIAMTSLPSVLRLQRRRRDGDAFAADVVEDVHLVGQRAAREDLVDPQGLLERPLATLLHESLDCFRLQSHPRPRGPRGPARMMRGMVPVMGPTYRDCGLSGTRNPG